MVSNIEIKKENVLAAYNGASAEQKQLLETLFGKDTFKPQDITERVRTFEDACNVLGSDHPLVDKYYQWADNVEDNDPFIRAVLKLEIITAALNEGWEPHFTAGEWRWIPWFWLYKSREEWENDEDEDWRNEHPYRELGGDWKTESAGFAYANSYYAPSYSSSRIGSRLCFKNSDLAAYCGTQFADLWMDYFLVRKSDNLINGEE